MNFKSLIEIESGVQDQKEKRVPVIKLTIQTLHARPSDYLGQMFKGSPSVAPSSPLRKGFH